MPTILQKSSRPFAIVASTLSPFGPEGGYTAKFTDMPGIIEAVSEAIFNWACERGSHALPTVGGRINLVLPQGVREYRSVFFFGPEEEPEGRISAPLLFVEGEVGGFFGDRELPDAMVLNALDSMAEVVAQTLGQDRVYVYFAGTRRTVVPSARLPKSELPESDVVDEEDDYSDEDF